MLSNLFSFQIGWEITDKVISVKEETFSCSECPRQRCTEQLLLSQRGKTAKGEEETWAAKWPFPVDRRNNWHQLVLLCQPYGNKNERKNQAKIFDNSLRTKTGAASPAVTGHSPHLCSSLALSLWWEPSSGFTGDSLASARLTLQLTGSKQSQYSQYFPPPLFFSQSHSPFWQ